MGNEIKIHSVQLLQNHWPAFPFLFCRKSLSVPSNFCQDTRVSVGFLCVIFPAQVYFLHSSWGGRCTKVPVHGLGPPAPVQMFQELWCLPARGGRCWSLWNSGKSPLVHLFLMLLLFSCLCVPEGGTPVTPEVEWRERERNGGEMGEREWRLERGIFQVLVSGPPANLEPTPTPSRNKLASARLSVKS